MSKHQIQLRVRYCETDKMGVVHHGNYINWFEAVRTDLCRTIGVPYSIVEGEGFNIAVAEVNVRHINPIFFDELVTIKLFLEKASPKYFYFNYEVLNSENKVCAKGYTKHIVMNKNLKKDSLPENIFNKFKVFKEQL